MRNITRRKLLKSTAGSLSALALSRALPAAGGLQRKLAPYAFRPLLLGEVRPAGWLENQVRIQANGMGGHLDEFWPDVGPNSGWLGGTGESWERGPYFLDGLVPLAYLLDDAILKPKAQKFVDWTLDHQQSNGMIGPLRNDDWWPRMVMLKALAQYYEATADARVLPVMTRYFHYQMTAMPQRPLKSWGKYRWQDEVLVVEWLYERTHDPKLLDLASLLRSQGFDWEADFADFRYTEATPRSALQGGGAANGGPTDRAMQSHGVNNAQALKTSPVLFRLTSDEAHRKAFWRQVEELDRYHGVPNGMFSCDEHLAGLEPQHGSELCSVVESMFSLEVALATFGDAVIGDRIEKLAFNALPGTFTDDMWAHQYDQQSNQIQVGLLTKPWTTNGPESNLYGLAPNFGCCTANFHQGWPKFAASLWMRTPDDGLAATLFAPCDVKTSVKGVPVRIQETTDYPFKGGIRFSVSPAKSCEFNLFFRVPGWAAGGTAAVNGKPLEAALTPGQFAHVRRTWKQGDVVELCFPMKPRLSRWFNRSVAVERGPLVFSHSPGESWVKLRDRPPTADWQVYPTKPWSYALAVDEATAGELKVTESPVGAVPFAKENAAVSLQVPAHRLFSWRSEDGVAASPHPSPISSDQPQEMLTLIPYASAKLRITAFPSTLS